MLYGANGSAKKHNKLLKYTPATNSVASAGLPLSVSPLARRYGRRSLKVNYGIY